MNRASQVILAATFAVGVIVGWVGKPTPKYVEPVPPEVDVVCSALESGGSEMFCIDRQGNQAITNWPYAGEIKWES